MIGDDWYDFLRELVDFNVRFLVVGAHALAVHGVPRATQDLDVWIDPSAENAQLTLNALVKFGAPVHALGVTLGDLSAPGLVVQIGMPPNRIDVLTGISGVDDFGAAWDARVSHTIRERLIPFLDVSRLKVNKLATGRKRDLADLESLNALDGPS